MPVLALVLACALWGLSFPVVKVLHLEQSARVGGATSVFLAAWIQAARFLAAAALLWLVAGRHRRPNSTEVRQGLWLALWGGPGMALQADALAHTQASTCAFLTQAYCVLLPLWECLRRKRAPAWRVVAATLAVVAGTTVLSGVRLGDLCLGRGEAETLLAAVLFTFQILTLEAPAFRHNRATPVTWVMFLAIGAAFVPAAVLTAPAPAALAQAGASWQALVLVLALAVFCSLGAFLLMNRFQPLVPATKAGLVYTSEPVFTALYVLFLPNLLGRLCGHPYPNEPWSATLLAGGSLILAANLLVHWRPAAAAAHPCR